MTEILLPLLLGAALLLGGGEALVRGAIAIARRFRLPPAVIGATVMGFGTSTPELLASLDAALRGSAPIAIGNVVGSNSANILLILGLAAVLAPISVERKAVQRDLLWMLAASAALLAVLGLAILGRWAGAGFLALIAIYSVVGLRSGGIEAPEAVEATPSLSGASAGALTLLGLGAAIWGAALFVDGAVALARLSGLSEAVIGVTVVAIGTSLPEVAASVAAARRGAGALALGNVLGSNIFNIFGVLGATALIVPLAPPAEIMARDLWVMLGASLALAVVVWGPGRLGRGLGLGFLAAFAAYLALMLGLSPA